LAKAKFDGVIESVHYKPNGEVDYVRAYVRRGPTFSDRLLIDRNSLVERLKAGKRYVVGRRQERLGSTFELSAPLRLVERDGKTSLIVGDEQADRDRLQGVPLV
jgi:hypothetical protein